MQFLLSADTIPVHSPPIWPQQRECSSISKLHQTFNCTSTATAVATATAMAIAMATMASSDLQSMTGPTIAPTASLKEGTSALRVTMVAPYYDSLGSKNSSPYQHSKPNTSPAPKPPENSLLQLQRDLHGSQKQASPPSSPLPINYDNQGAVTHITTEVISATTKHINVCDHNSRDLHARNIVDYSSIHTNDNVADILTKPLTKAKHMKFSRGMGLWSIQDLHGNGNSLKIVLYFVCLFMDGHPQATVVTFSLLTQSLLMIMAVKKATIGITCSARTLTIICLSGCFNHVWYWHLFISCITDNSKRGECCGKP